MSSKRLQTSDACKLSQNIFKPQEIIFKTLEIDKICAQLNKRNDDLRSAVSFFDWSHTFANSYFKTIKRVSGMQDYKIAELLRSTLTHDPKEVIDNFSSYVLLQTEKALLWKELNFAIPTKKSKFDNYLLLFEILFGDVCDNES